MVLPEESELILVALRQAVLTQPVRALCRVAQVRYWYQRALVVAIPVNLLM